MASCTEIQSYFPSIALTTTFKNVKALYLLVFRVSLISYLASFVLASLAQKLWELLLPGHLKKE